MTNFNIAFLERMFFHKKFDNETKALNNAFEEFDTYMEEFNYKYKDELALVGVRNKERIPLDILIKRDPHNTRFALSLYCKIDGEFKEIVRNLKTKSIVLTKHVNIKRRKCEFEISDRYMNNFNYFCNTLHNKFNKIYEQKLLEVWQSSLEKFESFGISLKELCYEFENYTPESAHEFFVRHKFENVPPVEKFPTISYNVIPPYPFAGFEVSREIDGYGHECGHALIIDYKNKKFTGLNFSSDD